MMNKDTFLSKTEDYLTEISDTIKPSDYRKIMKFILEGDLQKALKVFESTELKFDEQGLKIEELSPSQRKIITCLMRQPMNAREVSNWTGLQPHTVRSQVSLLRDKEIGVQCYKIFRRGSRYALYPKLITATPLIQSNESVSEDKN